MSLRNVRSVTSSRRASSGPVHCRWLCSRPRSARTRDVVSTTSHFTCGYRTLSVLYAIYGEGINPEGSQRKGRQAMDWKLELIAVPVSDIDTAKDFYVRIGFNADHDVTV